METLIMRKIKWLAAAAMMMAGAVCADGVTIVIDREYNSGANIAEYSAWDTNNPWDGTANNGSTNFLVGTSAGVVSAGGANPVLRRPAFFFEIPTGTTSAQVNNATLRVRLNTKTNPTTDLDIYSAALNTLGSKNAAYAKSMFSDASFADTGLGLSKTAANNSSYTFDVTSLVKAAIDDNKSVIAFRFQMAGDTTLTYGILNNYNLLGFNAATVEYRPALTLEVNPIILGLRSVEAKQRLSDELSRLPRHFGEFKRLI
jgi:hypothetical protein